MPNSLHVSSPPNETTYIKAVNEIRSNINKASGRSIHIYAFNIYSEQLKSAHDLLDKAEGRKAMRVSYSDDHNFIVRYTPSQPHQVANVSWVNALFFALVQLTPQPHAALPPGCVGIGSTTFQLGSGKKQADAGVAPVPNPSGLPSVVLEVGDSESLQQLRIDVKLWLETVFDVQLAILLSIDPPIAAHPNLPRMTIQLWRGFPPNHPPCSTAARQRVARMVWEADWTHTATPLYILLSDIFRGQVPAAYGNNDRVHLDTVAWRQAIIDAWHTSTTQCYEESVRAEYDKWIAEAGQRNAAGLKAAGVQIIDFNTYQPDMHVVTLFNCTPRLRGRLYPFPMANDLYILDFVDYNGTRVDSTNLIIYDVDEYSNERTQMFNQGTVPERKGTVDLYTLNPSGLVDIATADNQTLKRISFIYHGLTIQPIIE